MIKLNLGCGQNKLEGYINIDKYDSFAPDVVWDLEKFPWPFEDNSVDVIVMNHSLEHMGASADIFLSIIKELYRISISGAQVFIVVPHPRSDDFLSDPTHVRPVTVEVMELFSKKKNQKWKELGRSNTPLAIYLDVDFDITSATIMLNKDWTEQLQSGQIDSKTVDFAVNHYFNVVKSIQIVMTVRK